MLRIFIKSKPTKLSSLIINRGIHKPTTVISDFFKCELGTDGKRIILKDHKNEKEYSKNQILAASQALSNLIRNNSSQLTSKKSLKIAYLLDKDCLAVSSTMFGCWLGGNVAIPLNTAVPSDLLEHYITNSQSDLILTKPELLPKISDVAAKVNKPLITFEPDQLLTSTEEFHPENFQVPSSDSPALILYTSGTTALPKGVPISHKQLKAQISSLKTSWNMSSSDTVLHALPMNHVHGIVNAFLLPVVTGAKVIMLSKFETETVWRYILNIHKCQKDAVNVFMGVPTMYNYLIDEYDKIFSKNRDMADYIKSHCLNKMRLFISGSAPLPQPVFDKWHKITGHRMLERYGMTEIGMALSNPLIETEMKQRLPGFVGSPLPYVDVRLVDENKKVLLESSGQLENDDWINGRTQNKIITEETSDQITGNLYVKGLTTFKEYFMNPEATAKDFDKDGWFKTGDTALYDKNLDSFKILGRTSYDIIKTKGYKISALELETRLLGNEMIKDAAVVGLDCDVSGQKIVALVVLDGEAKENLKSLIDWCSKNFPTYSIPELRVIDALPRNQMGKVNKKYIIDNFDQVLSNNNS